MPSAADALPQLLGTLLDSGRTRLELLSVEVEEERLRLAALFIAAAVTVFCALVASVLLATGLVLLCEPAQRPLAVGLATALFAGAAAFGGWRWRRLAQRRPPLLQATLAELQRDHAAFAPGPR